MVYISFHTNIRFRLSFTKSALLLEYIEIRRGRGKNKTETERHCFYNPVDEIFEDIFFLVKVIFAVMKIGFHLLRPSITFCFVLLTKLVCKYLICR